MYRTQIISKESRRQRQPESLQETGKELEVIAEVSQEQIEEMKDFLKNTDISVEYVDNGITFDIIVTETKGESSATVRIASYHTNIVLIEKRRTGTF